MKGSESGNSSSFSLSRRVGILRRYAEGKESSTTSRSSKDIPTGKTYFIFQPLSNLCVRRMVGFVSVSQLLLNLNFSNPFLDEIVCEGTRMKNERVGRKQNLAVINNPEMVVVNLNHQSR